jgi:hypothetical protein
MLMNCRSIFEESTRHSKMDSSWWIKGKELYFSLVWTYFKYCKRLFTEINTSTVHSKTTCNSNVNTKISKNFDINHFRKVFGHCSVEISKSRANIHHLKLFGKLKSMNTVISQSQSKRFSIKFSWEIAILLEKICINISPD